MKKHNISGTKRKWYQRTTALTLALCFVLSFMSSFDVFDSAFFAKAWTDSDYNVDSSGKFTDASTTYPVGTDEFLNNVMGFNNDTLSMSKSGNIGSNSSTNQPYID